MTETHDFVVIGGGSAGAVLAARLSENRDARVLLLEAGGRDLHPLFHVPAGFARMTRGMGSWNWFTEPQAALGGRAIRFTQARVLGGGSSINAQIYTRGHARDYDGWRDAGCPGWGWADVLPYFRAAEDNDTFGAPFHGRGGPLGVSQPVAALPICAALFEAAGRLGIPRNPDLAGAGRRGVGFYQLTQRHARRSSAATAYLRPARGRTNLRVRTGAEAVRLEVENGRAVGATLLDGTAVRAAAEMILAAGAIGSPRLLLLSGIGPAGHLRAVGIPVLLDSPGVGANLQDHLDLFAIAECTGPHTYDRYARLPWSVLAGLRWLATRRGPAASSLFETGGFWFADPDASHPDLQLHLGLGSGIEAGVAAMPAGGVTLNSAYLRPRSRGTVRLASADPHTAPRIDPMYWSEPHDREMAIRGLKLVRAILRQEPLKPFVRAERLPGPDVRSDKDCWRYACEHAKTDHHPVGTCRMGSDDDAVVDPALRLRGIDGLRIVDASIMPALVSANTNATTIMIAEKAADLIRREYGA